MKVLVIVVRLLELKIKYVLVGGASYTIDVTAVSLALKSGIPHLHYCTGIGIPQVPYPVQGRDVHVPSRFPTTGIFTIGPLGPCPPPLWAVDDRPKGGPRSVDQKYSKSKVSHTATQSCHLELINARKVKPGSIEKCLALQFFPCWFYSCLTARFWPWIIFFGFFCN